MKRLIFNGKINLQIIKQSNLSNNFYYIVTTIVILFKKNITTCGH
jgi:hypothetical protein